MNKELEKMEDRIKNTPITKFGRLGLAYVRTTVIFDYIRVINNNKEQLVAEANKQAIATGQEAAIQLYDYFILEVSSFYDYVKILIKKYPELKFPELPEYLDKIYSFRCKIPAHLDKNEELTGEDFLNLYKSVFVEIGIEKISIDFQNYYDKCMELEK